MYPLPEELWAEAFMRLVNNARPLGMGNLDPNSRCKMSISQAEEMLRKHRYFDYVWGRPIKMSFREGAIHRIDLYDRDHGKGAARRILDQLVTEKNVR